MAPIRVSALAGLWQSLGESNGKVKVCSFSPSQHSEAQSEALRRLRELMTSAGGNSGFSEKYDILSVTLCRCKGREMAFLGCLRDLNERYKNRETFGLDRELGTAISREGTWRRRVLDYFKSFENLCPDSYPNVRVLLAFHVPSSVEVAESVLKGNFARLKKLDAGFIGDGIYLTLNINYAIEEYGFYVHQLDVVPVIVCAVIVGNPFPVIENPFKDDSNWLGWPIHGKADSHIAVVASDPAANEGKREPVPCPLEKWGQLEVNTEVCVSEAQVLPLGVLKVKKTA